MCIGFLQEQVLKNIRNTSVAMLLGHVFPKAPVCLLSRSYLKANKYTGQATQLMNGVFPFQKRKKQFFGLTNAGLGSLEG